MSAEPVPRVRQVGTVEEHRVSYDSATGELCPNCSVFMHDIESLEADLKLKNRKIRELEVDHDRRAQHHELWEPAQALFHHWQVVCNRRKSKWTTDRFWQVEPFLSKKKYGEELCRRAIDGAAYESWVTERRNGSLEVHNAWEKIFEKAGTVEKYANRAPRGWNVAYSIEMESWPIQRPPDTAVKSMWGIAPPKGWKPPAQQTSDGQVALIGVVDGD